MTYELYWYTLTYAAADFIVIVKFIICLSAQAMREALQKSPVIAPMYISEELFGWNGS